MRMLLPHPDADVDVTAAYAVARPVVPGRPWVVGLMASTADGAAAVSATPAPPAAVSGAAGRSGVAGGSGAAAVSGAAGLSGVIGGAGDREVFRAVRAIADVVLVGSGTVTAERYGPVRTPPDLVAARVARGQDPHPQLVVVSGRLSLRPDQRLFAEADGTTPRPLVAHPPEAPADRRAALDPVADLLEIPGGASGVDVVGLLAELGRRGNRVVVLEGGPTLNGALVAADLVDEMCLTLDPMVVGGRSPRIVADDGPSTARAWRPAHLLEHDGALFWRLLRDRR